HCLQIRRHLERLALQGPLDPAAADALDADALVPDGAVDLDLNVLEVGPEHAAADAGDLPAGAAEGLGLAAPGGLVAQDRLLSTAGTRHAHIDTRSLLRP